MATGSDHRVLAVFDDRTRVEQVQAELVKAGIPADKIAVDGDRARRASLQAEMAEEANGALTSPPAGPIPKESARGAALAIPLCCAVCLVIALPFTAVPFGGLAWWWRLCVLAAVGVAAGATAGFIAGGGILARGGPAKPAAADRGVLLAVADSSPTVIQTLQRAAPVRLDVVSAQGAPLRTVTTEADRDTRGVVQAAADDLRHDPDDPSPWATS